MMVPDSSLSYIEADSQDILALYRSSSTVAVEVDGFQSKKCDAFICAVKEGDLFSIYLVLLANETRNTLLYTFKTQPNTEGVYADRMEEAVGFAKDIGFTMQSVNLDYSKALREVIISDTRVIRFPKVTKKGASGKIVSRATAADKTVMSLGKDENIIPPSGKVEEEKFVADKNGDKGVKEEKFAIGGSLDGGVIVPERHDKEESAGIRVELAKVTAEKYSAEKASAGELAAAKSELEGLKAEITRSEAIARKELAAVRTEIKNLSGVKVSPEKPLADELTAARVELEGLIEQKNSAQGVAVKELAAVLTRIEQLSEGKSAAERSAADRLSAAKTELETVIKEKALLEKVAVEELTFVRGAIKNLAEAKSDTEKAQDRELSAARAMLDELKRLKKLAEATASEELSLLSDEVKKVAAKKGLAEKTAIANLSNLRNLLQGVISEIISAEGAVIRLFSDIRGEAEGLLPKFGVIENLPYQEVAAGKDETNEVQVKIKTANVQTDRDRKPRDAAAEEKGAEQKGAEEVETNRFAGTMLPDRGNKPKIDAAEESRLLEPADSVPFEEPETLFSGNEKIDNAGFPSLPAEQSSTSFTKFQVDPSLSFIEFRSVEDVIAIYQSLNVARVNTLGHKPENAEAFICGLNKGGKPSVYIALQLIDKKETLVYLPEAQPANSSEYDKTVQAAVEFFERAGFIMDTFALRGKEESHAKIIEKIPVLRRAP